VSLIVVGSYLGSQLNWPVVDNNKMDLREMEWGGMDWIVLAENRHQWKVLVNSKELSGSINCWEVPE
jgi:hypothetical protein